VYELRERSEKGAEMKAFLAGVKRWWLRRFRGVVKPPAGQQGTTWQQHPMTRIGELAFACKCGNVMVWSQSDYVIRAQEHVDGCAGLMDTSTHRIADLAKTRIMDLQVCQCPVTDARYIKICPQCHTGHWKQAK
jgi:hypothetical protein